MSNANSSSMKKCFKCGKQQPLTEFYAHARMADGLLGKCKACCRSYSTEYRTKHIDKCRAYDSARALLPHRVKMAIELQRLRRIADRRKDICHNKVIRAVSKGLLVRMPCQVCGDKKTVGHHESYDRPLDVVWLCQIHHVARHKQMFMDGIEP